MEKMKRVDNEYILKVHYLFRQFDNGIWYDCIVMDLYEMNFFEYKIKKELQGGIPVNDREQFITCLFEASKVLIIHGINHLDINPNNFLVKLARTGGNEVIDKIVLGDFGQAKMVNEETNWYNKCGNPLFAPPECWSEDTTNRDQWGMATTMMFALMSAKAFYGLMILPYQRSSNHLQSLYRTVSNVKTPKNLLDLYMKLIQLEPSDRLDILEAYNRMKLCKDECQYLHVYAESERVSMGINGLVMNLSG